MITLVGLGYDIHRFSPTPRPLMLGGIKVHDTQGLDGHSDADVLCHALADAILGAIGERDIGYWFPPSDPSCENISSLLIVQKAVELLGNMGSGVAGMFETSMVAVLVAAMCALIREYGGFEALLAAIRRIFKGNKGGQLGIGCLVSLMDIATANNTVAIVMAAPIAKEISEEYGISGEKSASLLDTFSCIAQGVIPYGAQILVAISAVGAMGAEISAFQILPKLYYPMLLALSSLVFIYLVDDKE